MNFFSLRSKSNLISAHLIAVGNDLKLVINLKGCINITFAKKVYWFTNNLIISVGKYSSEQSIYCNTLFGSATIRLEDLSLYHHVELSSVPFKPVTTPLFRAAISTNFIVPYVSFPYLNKSPALSSNARFRIDDKLSIVVNPFFITTNELYNNKI